MTLAAGAVEPAPPGGFRLGDVELVVDAASAGGEAAWSRLAAACAHSSGEGWPLPVARHSVVAVDGRLRAPRLPAPLPSLLAGLRGLDTAEERWRLRHAGFECPSLETGAWLPAAAGDEPPLVLWRPRPPADRTGRVMLPLYPVVRAHAQRDEVVLHAGAVAGAARAALLLGRSGSGKSTATRNARRAGGTALCDDGVVLARGLAGAPVAVPLPSCVALRRGWRGPFQALRRPLAALCFLERSSRERLSPLPALEAVPRLAAAALTEVPSARWLPRPLRTRVFHALCDLARRVPCFVLELRPRPDYFDLLRREASLDA